ncbi:MAG: hypothetical protein KBD01_16590 [Acidobacteria bacterium]|nr:hypothetical protein [Acidobacteriota bacterium]
MSTAPPLAPQAAERRARRNALEREVCRLAGELAQAAPRLKSALEEKERLSRLLDAVLERLEAGVILLDPAGRVLAANAAARAIGAVGEPGLRLDAALAGRGRTGESGPYVEPQGTAGARWLVRTSSVPLPTGGEGRLLLVHDVTRVVQLEERARRRSNLEALGRMAAEIAHEVRNPLGSLELFSSMLADEVADRPEARELAEQILLGVRQLSGTVTRTLAAVRGWTLRREPADAAALAREALEFVRPVADSRGVRLAGPEAGHRLPALLDVEGIRQSLLNLLTNALEVTAEGGMISLAAWARGGDVVLEVRDGGPGVPAELRERICEPFFTTRSRGTGLGLAVVERVALAHGGAIEIEDAPAGGAIFRISLPGALAAEPEPELMEVGE